jgi:U3 small nucleolar RNA-associated protein 21
MSSTEEEENTNISNVPIESKFAEHADLVTLSGLPLSRWAQLPFMDAIRERNRPIEPVHKPKHAPFFLPTTSTLTGFEFDLDDDTTKQQGQLSRLIERKADALLPHTPFARQLDALSLDADILALDEQQREMFDACFDALKQMTPSGVDMELRQLRIDDDAVSARSAYITSVQAIKFVRMINVRTTRGIDYELCSAYMAAFVRIHRLDLCTAADTLTIALHECRHALHSRWLHVDALCARTLGIVQWLKSATV